MFRKIIQIRAEDTPNVEYALAQARMGLTPTGCDENGRPLCPGVLSWEEYCERRATWDVIRQTIGLDAKFYEGKEVKLFPSNWLDRAERYAAELLEQRVPRRAKAIGCDPGEGAAKSSWCIGDERGIIKLMSRATPDTSIITMITIDLIEQFEVDPENVLFDRGGGGKQHADLLRRRGFNVQTVGFGEPAVSDIRRTLDPTRKKDLKEMAYEYCNMRAQMYAEAAELLDPSRRAILGPDPRPGYWNPSGGRDLPVGYEGFAIPRGVRGDNSDKTTELRGQLEPIPLLYNSEQRIYLPPKRAVGDRKGTRQTMMSLIGHSPDEADAFVLMVHRLLHKSNIRVAGAISRR